MGKKKRTRSPLKPGRKGVKPLSASHEKSFQDAILLFQGGRLADAERLLSKISVKNPKHPNMLHLRALVALNSGNVTQAAAYIKKALIPAPKEPQFLVVLGAVLGQQGDVAGAIDAFQKSIAQEPNNAEALYNFGKTLRQAGRLAEAELALKNVLELQPHNTDALINLGNILCDCDRGKEAIDQFRAAIQIAPYHESAHINLCYTLLELGNGKEALAASDHLLEVKPGFTDGLAFKSCALQILGEVEALKRLIDIPRLVYSKRVVPPLVYESLAEFNAKLGEHLASHPDLVFEPKGKSTFFGSQVNKLNTEPKGLIADFEQVLHEAYRDYREALDIDPGHPFAAAAPRDYEINVFGTILSKGGHQLPHFHRAGWLSGVYYVELPEEVSEPNPERYGCIEFGRPPPEMKINREPYVEMRQPEEGLIFLFPSYLHHNTVPLSKPARRISIAFDFMPVD